jgi:hypothetical protein
VKLYEDGYGYQELGFTKVRFDTKCSTCTGFKRWKYWRNMYVQLDLAAGCVALGAAAAAEAVEVALATGAEVPPPILIPEGVDHLHLGNGLAWYSIGAGPHCPGLSKGPDNSALIFDHGRCVSKLENVMK